jgi:hypothetical protein
MHTRSLVAVALAAFGMVAAPAALAQTSGSSGASGAPGIAPNSLVNPSIEITGFSGTPPNLCATPIGSHSITTLWTSSLPADSDSDSFDVMVPGFGDVSAYVESNVGYGSPATNVAASYGVNQSMLSTSYTVAANTTITYRITTYPNNTRTGPGSFVSEMDFNCTTGAVLARRNFVPNAAVVAPVPVGGPLVGGALVLALAGLGMAVLRRRRA